MPLSSSATTVRDLLVHQLGSQARAVAD